jgi:hypothetical protein
LRVWLGAARAVWGARIDARVWNLDSRNEPVGRVSGRTDDNVIDATKLSSNDKTATIRSFFDTTRVMIRVFVFNLWLIELEALFLFGF